MLERLKIRDQKIRIGNQTIRLLPKEDRITLLICICIALIFWVLVKLSQSYSAQKSVVFNFHLPEGKTFAAQPPGRMDIRIDGRGWELMFDYLLNPTIFLSYSLTDEEEIELSREALSSSIERQIAFNSIRVLENSYQPINLRLEEGLRKKVPIVLLDSFTFSPGYVLQEPIILKPDSVQVSGPYSLVNSIEIWETTLVTLKDLKSNLTQPVSLNLPPPELTLNVKEVQATIQTEQITEKSLFIPLQVHNAPDSIRYFPEKVKVTCTVGLSIYNTIDTSDFVVEIDLKKFPFSDGKHTLPIQMTKKPAQALTVQFTPKSAEFFIFKQ